jgi:nucleoside-triphosphatase THEP1
MSDFVDYKRIIKIITGERDSGKTHFCLELIRKLQKFCIQVTGVVSPGRYEGNNKIEIFAKDIITGIKKLLATFEPGWDPAFPKREWRLRIGTLKWGDAIIQNSVPTEVLFIDELGFLEFEKDRGWASSFRILISGDYQFAFVVVRPKYIDVALNRFGKSEIINIDKGKSIPSLSETYLELIRTELHK